MGGGSGESCGGQICGQNEFCCGPPACGNCRNILTGPNCPTSCGGSKGAGGAGGASGATCPAVPPQPGGNCTVGLNCYYEDCAGAGRTVASCVAGSTVEPRWQVATGACTAVTCPNPSSLTCPAGQLCFISAGGAVLVTCGTNTCGTSAISVQLPAVLQRGLLGARIGADRNHRLLQHVPTGRMPLSDLVRKIFVLLLLLAVEAVARPPSPTQTAAVGRTRGEQVEQPEVADMEAEAGRRRARRDHRRRGYGWRVWLWRPRRCRWRRGRNGRNDDVRFARVHEQRTVRAPKLWRRGSTVQSGRRWRPVSDRMDLSGFLQHFTDTGARLRGATVHPA